MRYASNITDAALLDLALAIAGHKVRATERTLTDAIEDRRVAPERLTFLRAELENARRNRSALFSIPRLP